MESMVEIFPRQKLEVPGLLNCCSYEVVVIPNSLTVAFKFRFNTHKRLKFTYLSGQYWDKK